MTDPETPNNTRRITWIILPKGSEYPFKEKTWKHFPSVNQGKRRVKMTAHEITRKMCLLEKDVSEARKKGANRNERY